MNFIINTSKIQLGTFGACLTKSERQGMHVRIERICMQIHTGGLLSPVEKNPIEEMKDL